MYSHFISYVQLKLIKFLCSQFILAVPSTEVYCMQCWLYVMVFLLYYTCPHSLSTVNLPHVVNFNLHEIQICNVSKPRFIIFSNYGIPYSLFDVKMVAFFYFKKAVKYFIFLSILISWCLSQS